MAVIAYTAADGKVYRATEMTDEVAQEHLAEWRRQWDKGGVVAGSVGFANGALRSEAVVAVVIEQ